MNNNQYRPTGFSFLTPVIKNLLIINGLFFVAQIVIQRAYPGLEIADYLGLRFPGAHDFRIYQVVTYMFMHGDFWHLFFNMFALWMFGKPIEERFGSKRFLIYYFATGIGAAAFHYGVVWLWDMPHMFHYIDAFLKNPDVYTLQDVLASNPEGLYHFENVKSVLSGLQSQYSSPDAWVQQSVYVVQQYRAEMINGYNVIGASGAVFGILLAFGMMFPNSLIYIYFAIPIKAKWFVLIYGLLELWQGIAQNGSNIAHLAHVGGMLFGFLLIKLWNRRTNRPQYF
jgi:membrane associated rhomboid family serine protease